MKIEDINNKLTFINETYEDEDNLVLTRLDFSDDIWEVLVNSANDDEGLYFYGDELSEMLYDNSYFTQEMSDRFAEELGSDKISNLLDNMYYKIILKDE